MSVHKKYLIRLVVLVLAITSISLSAKAQTDKIEGLWYNDVKSGKILIYKQPNGKFYGKVVWLR